jgi:hypothetical protein
MVEEDQDQRKKVSTIDPTDELPKRIMKITEEVRRNISRSWLFNICRNSQEMT